MDLSILIPARNEMFLAQTIEDIKAHAKSDFEIIAVLDGAWADPVIIDHPRVNLIYHSQSIGQRAACNEAARVASGKYLMKVDAHCSFEDGFDVKLLADMRDDWTVAPAMRNLHAFNWVCANGHRRYQGPSGACAECGKPTSMEVVWIAKENPQSTSYCFDPTPHFQYFKEFASRPEGKGDLSETMSLQGSFFMISRKRWFELNICDENWGSWGSQGIEVALKTWLSGGRVIVNKRTWYAHLFRTQGGDFGFPYPIAGSDVKEAQKFARDLVYGRVRFPLQILPTSWLINRFWPVSGWTAADLEKLMEMEKSNGKSG